VKLPYNIYNAKPGDTLNYAANYKFWPAAIKYLQKRHSNIACVISDLDIHFYGKLEMRCDYVPSRGGFYCESTITPKYRDALTKCMDSGKRFSLGFLSITAFKYGIQEYQHILPMVIDNKTKVADFHDPNGQGVTYKAYRPYIEKFCNEFGLTMNDSTGNACYGMQKAMLDEFEHRGLGEELKKGRGYCAIWSLWQLDQRMTYPDIPPVEAYEKALEGWYKEKNYALHQFIADYIINVSNVVNQSARTNGLSFCIIL